MPQELCYSFYISEGASASARELLFLSDRPRMF